MRTPRLGASRLVAVLTVAALVVPGAAVAIETPQHTVVRKLGEDLEVRDYPAYLVAETRVGGSRSDAGNEAFRRLAGYIFGGNKRKQKYEMTAPVTVTAGAVPSQKLAMTAPVTQTESGAGEWAVQFVMPRTETLATLPEPDDARVTLRAVPARRVAVIHYSGTWSESNYQEHLALLRAALLREKLVAVGEPVWARYDAPFKPWFLRHNEIFLERR